MLQSPPVGVCTGFASHSTDVDQQTQLSQEQSVAFGCHHHGYHENDSHDSLHTGNHGPHNVPHCGARFVERKCLKEERIAEMMANNDGMDRQTAKDQLRKVCHEERCARKDKWRKDFGLAPCQCRCSSATPASASTCPTPSTGGAITIDASAVATPVSQMNDIDVGAQATDADGITLATSLAATLAATAETSASSNGSPFCGNHNKYKCGRGFGHGGSYGGYGGCGNYGYGGYGLGPYRFGFHVHGGHKHGQCQGRHHHEQPIIQSEALQKYVLDFTQDIEQFTADELRYIIRAAKHAKCAKQQVLGSSSPTTISTTSTATTSVSTTDDMTE